MNELAKETSPYLLQHAENPVHWKAWGKNALEKAKTEGKLIIVSSGYSACHWCHVMEHESFENAEVADIMNAHYVSIKVDREERPDVDAVYMKAVQLMTQHGGWPMNVVCLPDGRPVWGGTYFPRQEWMASLQQLAELYKTDPQKMVDYAEKLYNGIQSISLIESQKSAAGIPDNQDQLVQKWSRSFDRGYGGHARAPKFMLPNNLKFLMRYGHETQNQNVLDYVDTTLTRMAWGGLFDTVDGGFSRYSVDMKWHVPHFEKMAYDNGQLVSLYADAYKRTQNPLYREVIEKTLAFVNREWANGEGGFYSALDADSLSGGKLEEGAFYVWTAGELKRHIGNGYPIFADVFNINDFGHWEHGNHVLIQTETLEAIAAKHSLSPEALAQKKREWEKQLFEVREKRAKPRLDDKCLTSWNAVLCLGFLDAYRALGDKAYLETAVQNASFTAAKLWSPDGNLHRTYKSGKASIDGYLEDYAWVTAAFLSLYETTFEERYLHDAKQLTDCVLEHFYDETAGFFRFSARGTELIAPHYEIEDNVIPAANSVVAANLFQLSLHFENGHYERTARRMLAHIAPAIDYPSAFSNWLMLARDFFAHRELVVCGENAREAAAVFHSGYLPGVSIAGTRRASALPFFQNRFQEGKTLFYVCHNKSCSLPVEDPARALALLTDGENPSAP
jgi:uncharacterized protein YyaL (SSP411 family)